MSMIGVISPPVKTSPVPSNCKITQEGNQVVLTDDTSARPFIVSQEFNAITYNFTDVINEVSTNDSMRVISFGSEFSTPNITQIKEWSIQFINQRLQANRSQSIPISAGLVYDKDVLDLLSLKQGKSDKFELVDSDDIYSAMDLIDISFEKFKRFKESVFVLHIGMEPFFEWVVVPRADNFVPTPSLAGLPPNEKLIFILKQFPTITESGITTGFDKFRRLSNIFRLVLDTFCDIQTLWVFHFATDVTFKSNNALIKIAGYVSNIQNNSSQFQISRSNLFDIHSEEEEADFKGLNPDLLSNYLTDQQRRAAEAEAEELEKKLNMQSSDDDGYYRKGRKRKVGKKKNENGEYEYEYEYSPYGKSKGSKGKLRKRRVKKGPDGEYEYEYYEYADGDGAYDNTTGKGRRRRKKKSGEGDDDGNYYDDDDLGDLDVIEELNKRKQKRVKRSKSKGTTSESESITSKELSPLAKAKKAAEEEARAKKAAEKEAHEQKLKELLEKRKQGKKKADEDEDSAFKKKTSKKGKSKNEPDSMSHRDKINMMMKKFRDQLAREGSDEYDIEEEEDLDDMSFLNFDTTGMSYEEIQREKRRRLAILNEKKRRAANAKRRENEHELLRLQMLAVNALSLARRADPNQSPISVPNQKGTSFMNDENETVIYEKQKPVTNEEMKSKDEEIVKELKNVEDLRKDRVDELLELNKKLNDKRRKHEKYQAMLKARRGMFIDIHNEILQARLKKGMPPSQADFDILENEYDDDDNDGNGNNSSKTNNKARGRNNRKGGNGQNGENGDNDVNEEENDENGLNSSKGGGLNNKKGGKGTSGKNGLNSSGRDNRTGKNKKGGNGDDEELNLKGKKPKSAKFDRTKAKIKVYDTSKSKRRVNTSEYQQTKMLLEREIETVKKEIELIKRRQKAINHEI